MGYVWCDGYVWDMCGVRYVWDMCGVRYANNLLKNPATKRLSGKRKKLSTCNLVQLLVAGNCLLYHRPEFLTTKGPKLTKRLSLLRVAHCLLLSLV